MADRFHLGRNSTLSFFPQKNPARRQAEAWWNGESDFYREPTNLYTDGAISIYFRMICLRKKWSIASFKC